MRRILDLVALTLAAVTVAGMFLTVRDRDPIEPSADFPNGVYRAEVVSVELLPCAGTGDDGPECRVITFRLREGPDTGAIRSQEFAPFATATPRVHRGDEVVLYHYGDSDPPNDYVYADRERRATLWWLAAFFACVVIGLGRLRGLAALAGLVASLFVILQYLLPALLDGRDPVVVAVLAATAIAYLALYLAHGVNPLTTVALLGTILALALTALLSWLFTSAAHFSGLATEEALTLDAYFPGIDFVGLILAGTVIGALGALDDMTVTQASAVAELHAANPSLSARELYRRALRIGRDHISSTVNTLALAYAGASLPTLLLFEVSAQSLGTVLNGEVIAVEVVRTLVGSIGLVASVPLTTALAAFVVRAGIHETGRHAPRAERPRGSERRARSGRPAPRPPTDEEQFWRL